jgi:hypothetical protein
MFGDFGADSSKFDFSSTGAVPIRHYRYSTPDFWFTVRGKDEGTITTAMKAVASTIVTSEHFAGRSFSAGDAYIADTMGGYAGPGSATDWRRINTVHHLTRVIQDLGLLRGFAVADRVIAPFAKQESLFGDA